MLHQQTCQPLATAKLSTYRSTPINGDLLRKFHKVSLHPFARGVWRTEALTCRAADDRKRCRWLDPSGRRTRSAVVPGDPAVGSGFRAARFAACRAARSATLSAALRASASASALLDQQPA